jgi:hypothetical protein
VAVAVAVAHAYRSLVLKALEALVSSQG